MLDALNILSGFDLHRYDSATRKHLVIEAMRRAYRDRAIYLGDPDFVKMPLAQLTSVDYAAGQRSSIRTDKAMPSNMLPGIESEPAGLHTTHFSVLDADGNRVAATISINLFFGAGYMPPKTGVLLNNTMDDFSTKPGRPNAFGLVGATANAIAPNKRSLSSMSPTFVETSKGLMIEGSPGGSYIISMVLLGTLNYLDGMNAADIVKYPRYHHQYLPDEVDYEAGGAERRRNQGAAGHGPHAAAVRPAVGQYAGHHLGFRHRQSAGGIRPARRGRRAGVLEGSARAHAAAGYRWQFEHQYVDR